VLKVRNSFPALSCLSTTLRPFAVVAKYIGSFYFLDQYFAETMTETKRLQFGFSPEFGPITASHITAHSIMSSLTSSLITLYFFVYLRISEVIFVHQNLISNRLTYLVHAKSTGELPVISFGFSGRSVRSLVSAKRSANS